ncbi:carboxypeptidase family protein [Pseudomaricurvus alkylphenolicus]|uniref:M14 family metallopeptidase n=1 Tax=Pseudomaricurvus alkylphenolicus TaxID=1306991 RepID=UPI0014241419|nr:M14-type cytosolic carboxypeptidase [Pseudomaricurvus alkylphenolicus]NIB42664.1 carboxypeptidase family protein [Pseudomaricurvus alkylphenolicus]
MRIFSHFDGGSIDVVNQEDIRNIELRLRSDNKADFSQWFYFGLHCQVGDNHQLNINNAGSSSYPQGWEGYKVCASYDRDNWFRIPTRYDGTNLEFEIKPESDLIYFAYFPPYSFERHLNLLAKVQLSEQASIRCLGHSVEGRPLSLIKVGEQGSDKAVIWMTARQHPGETMAEWFIEGALERLLDSSDAIANDALDRAVFYLVPNMNPDGGVLGNLRTNAKGENLNRAWSAPSLVNSPEVFHVREEMNRTGVDLFLDIHGDENIPYVFLSGSEGVPSFNKAMEIRQDHFKRSFLDASADFQTTHGYPKKAPNTANMATATSYVAETHRCLAFTLEMPFKDNDDRPCREKGWSKQRSKILGKDTLAAIRNCIDTL